MSSAILDKRPGLNKIREFRVSFDDLLTSFLRRRSEKTRTAYQQDLRDFLNFLQCPNAMEALSLLFESGPGWANKMALDFKASLVERQLSPATVNRRLSTLRSLAKLARTLGIVNWSLEVENVPHQSYRNTAGPGLNAIKSILNSLEVGNHDKDVRDLAIMRLLFDLGLRRGEVTCIDYEDVNLVEAKIDVLGKGRSQKMTLTLSSSCVEAIGRWLAIRGYEVGPLFTNFDRALKGKRLSGNSVYRIIRELGRRAGVETRPHGIRHTAITQACLQANTAGLAIEDVLQFSRHSDIRTLLIYRDSEADLQGRFSDLISQSTKVSPT